MRVLAIVALTACSYTPPVKFEETLPDGNDIDALLPDSSIDSPPGLVCPSSFMDINGSKYFVQNNSDEIKAWKDAETVCAGMGTDIHLAVITTAGEADALAPLLSNSRLYWVGGFQPNGESGVGDGWTGLDGQPALDNHWAFDNPDDNSGLIVTEDDFAQFIELDGNGQLHDDLGTASRFWICECDGVPVAPGLQIP